MAAVSSRTSSTTPSGPSTTMSARSAISGTSSDPEHTSSGVRAFRPEHLGGVERGDVTEVVAEHDDRPESALRDETAQGDTLVDAERAQLDDVPSGLDRELGHLGERGQRRQQIPLRPLGVGGVAGVDGDCDALLLDLDARHVERLDNAWDVDPGCLDAGGAGASDSTPVAPSQRSAP